MDNDSLQELWTKTVTMLKEAGQEDPSQSIRPVTFSASHKAKLKDLPTIDLADHKRGQSEDGENLSEDKTLPITKSKRLAKQRTPLSGFDMYTEIGRGGMGTVYRGRQRSLDRDVALKQLLERHESEEFRQSFVTEARVTGWLDHPNIVPVYDFSQSLEGDPLFAMKLIHGTSWNETLNELKVGEQLEKQLKVLVAVCNGVAFAHSRSIVHCDLKPITNIRIPFPWRGHSPHQPPFLVGLKASEMAQFWRPLGPGVRGFRRGREGRMPHQGKGVENKNHILNQVGC